MNHLTIALENLKKTMGLNTTNSDTLNQLISPITNVLEDAEHQFKCHVLPDEEWIKSGILRVLDNLQTGCAFLQNSQLLDLPSPSKSHYFESFKSTRRLNHLQAITKQLLQEEARLAFKENSSAGLHDSLKSFHIYAGDGHFHAASSHDEKDYKERKNAVGHLYALNLRNNLLSHLKLASDGSKRKPHDMGVLKKMEVGELRQGAQKGERVLYVWDRAAVDFSQWDKWKQVSGIYMLSRVKKNHSFQKCGHLKFDREDEVNAGVISDEQVGNGAGRLIRRVTYKIPETGEAIQFITTLGIIVPPGVIAQLYFMRWRIEKSFDELKNKLYEQKAWAKSNTAKTMQAEFTILAYNLAKLLNAKIESDGDIKDERNIEKRENRLRELKQKAQGYHCEVPSLRKRDLVPSQLSVKFYRWLRVHLYKDSSWRESLRQLKRIYACF